MSFLNKDGLTHFWQNILHKIETTVPTVNKAHQQLVTDGDGNTTWADRLAYEQTTTQVLCDVADAGEYQNYDLGNDLFNCRIPALNYQPLIAGNGYTVEIGNQTFDVVANSNAELRFEYYPPDSVDGTFYNVIVKNYYSNQYRVSEMGGIGGQFLEGYSFKLTSNVTDLKQIDPKYLPDGIATETYVDNAVSALVDSSPDTLNTLNELAAALGDDPNFATTIATQMGNKVDKVEGKGLSTNDYTTSEKTKLAGIAEGANKTTVDATLSSTSTNPVQNKAVHTALAGKSDTDHTHSYAGSSSVGGAATSANKLNTNAGSATQPVYFANGVPVNTTYTLAKSVPADAVFTDTTYEAITNDEIDAICGATIVSASEVSL